MYYTVTLRIEADAYTTTIMTTHAACLAKGRLLIVYLNPQQCTVGH
jgi:hypothetical protein